MPDPVVDDITNNIRWMMNEFNELERRTMRMRDCLLELRLLCKHQKAGFRESVTRIVEYALEGKEDVQPSSDHL